MSDHQNRRDGLFKKRSETTTFYDTIKENLWIGIPWWLRYSFRDYTCTWFMGLRLCGYGVGIRVENLIQDACNCTEAISPEITHIRIWPRYAAQWVKLPIPLDLGSSMDGLCLADGGSFGIRFRNTVGPDQFHWRHRRAVTGSDARILLGRNLPSTKHSIRGCVPTTTTDSPAARRSNYRLIPSVNCHLWVRCCS
ncbi:hypothetical protein P171DRAFT_427856 [Karstenula rhodostoma CBS 690.94]|uniref:Uncharacterized protein n=1 Tax=Karstenula rhodostoma CBS 690.94 TaxID=1392251 RepID=A0A9P4UH05_9PLEO|nr:hypothetical protein P171DRAFT_427856 [Karstenula rhodostoma CBS 690.94]